MLFPRSIVWKRPLTWAELLYAFRIYLQEATKDSKKFLLIDGLDEFNGDPVDITSFIDTLLTPEVKVCISSRPWIVFEDAFSQRPSLRVEELGEMTFDTMLSENSEQIQGLPLVPLLIPVMLNSSSKMLLERLPVSFCGSHWSCGRC